MAVIGNGGRTKMRKLWRAANPKIGAMIAQAGEKMNEQSCYFDGLMAFLY